MSYKSIDKNLERELSALDAEDLTDEEKNYRIQELEKEARQYLREEAEEAYNSVMDGSNWREE